LIGGYFYDYFGAVKLFEISAFLSFISMILAFIASFYNRKVNNSNEETGYEKVITSSDVEQSNEEREYEKVITSSSDIEIVERN